MTGPGSYALDAARGLSPRMRDVLGGPPGEHVKETARRLSIAEGTVRTIRQAAFAILGVSNMEAARTEARRRGELL